MTKPGLYANIHAKRKRIAAGSGEKMRKPGSAGAPTKANFKRSAKTAKKKRDLKYANSRSREIKRADSQKKRRAAKKRGKNIKGKDYDHKDQKFKSIKKNRGNDGKGTKKEK